MSSDKEENTLLPPLTSVPKKRGNRARWASGVIFLATTSLVLAFAFSSPTENECVRASHSKERNSTGECFTKKEILTFPDVFATALSLFGVVLGTLVDRLSLVAEEYRHREQRYDGSWKKMFKACFSGIRWSPVILLIILATISLIILIIVRNYNGKPWCKIQYLMYILSGVGVGPLVMHLLNLNTQSKIHISMILEENQTNVANGLAWHYYINYLQPALPAFKEAVRSSNLRYKKLVLLISLDCIVKDKLNDVDDKIVELRKTGNEGEKFRFTIYKLTVGSETYELAIEYVKEPLHTLGEMCKLKGNKAVEEDDLKEHVNLVHRSLHEILSHKTLKEWKEACVFVCIDYEEFGNLKNGRLAQCIINMIKKSNGEDNTVDGSPGFITLKQSNDSDKTSKSAKYKGESLDNRKLLEIPDPIDDLDELEDNPIVQESGV